MFSSKPSSGTSKPASNTTIPKPSDVVKGNPTKNPGLQLEPGAVYIALFQMSSNKTFHWALVVATNGRTGMMYHNTNRGEGFFFEARLHAHLLNSDHLLSLVKISRITSYDRDFHKYFAKRLESVPINDHRCRTWLREALVLASEEGLIGISMSNSTFDAIGDEAVYSVQHAVEGEDPANKARIITSVKYKA